MCRWKFGILFAIIALAGCAERKEYVPMELEQPKPVHPEWVRSPAKCVTPQYNVAASGAGSIVTMPYKEYINSQACNRDVLRYISGLTSMVCFYRQDLKEKRCSYYYPEKPIKKENE